MEEKIYCSHCGILIDDDDYDEINGQLVCSDCISRYTTTCERCGATIWDSDAYGDDYTTLCCHCYENYYSRCTECDALIHNDDAYEYEGESYCSECYHDIRDSNSSIHDYGYKPEPIFYASTESIMKNALKKVFLNKFFYERIDTVDGDILKINCTGTIERSGFDTHRDLKFGGWYDDYDMYYTMHEQLLLDMCGCFGVDEDDVIMLLDYGYSADEIEAMLCDYSLLNETIDAIKEQEAC